MKRIIALGTCAALAFAGAAFGRTIVDASKMGKAEFFGYVGDFVDSKKITGITLIKGDKATDEQKHVVAVTAQTQHIEAFIDIGGKVQPLVDPTPSQKPAAPPPVEQQAPAQQQSPHTP